jgi:hypothetical protein
VHSQLDSYTDGQLQLVKGSEISGYDRRARRERCKSSLPARKRVASPETGGYHDALSVSTWGGDRDFDDIRSPVSRVAQSLEPSLQSLQMGKYSSDQCGDPT